MALIAKGNDGQNFEYELTPAGTYQAVIFNIFDLGNQKEEYKGQQKVRHKISIGFELVGQTYKSGEYAGKPMTKYKEYSITLFEDKGLGGLIPMLIGRQLTEAEIKNGYDLESLIGKNCLLTIAHKVSQLNRTYAKIANIGGIVAGMTVTAPTLPRDFVPKHIADIQAQAVKDAHTPAPTDFYTEPTREEMEADITRWINEKKINKQDANNTIKMIRKAKLDENAPWTDEDAKTLYERMKKLAESKDLTTNTGFNPAPVQPPVF